MKNKKRNHKTINDINEQFSVASPQLCKLDIEELNKVNGGEKLEIPLIPLIDEPVAV